MRRTHDQIGVVLWPEAGGDECHVEAKILPTSQSSLRFVVRRCLWHGGMMHDDSFIGPECLYFCPGHDRGVAESFCQVACIRPQHELVNSIVPAIDETGEEL